MPIGILLLAVLLLPHAALAQQSGPVIRPAVTFQSWALARSERHPAIPPRNTDVDGAGDRAGNAALGGVIGAAAGIVFCTVVSNIANDRGTGFSTCTAKGYLLIGGVGGALGLLVGLGV